MSAAVSFPSDDGRTHLAVISNSEVSCFRRCVREWYYRYIALRRPRRTSEALRFGTFFHIGLNAWWGEPGEQTLKLAAALQAIRARAAEKPDDADPFELVKAEELLLGYTARWGDEDYTTLAVEVGFEMPLINPETGATSRTFKVGGKIDAIAMHGSRKRGVEHKTTSDDIGAGSDYWRFVSSMDPQVSTYMPGARSAGHDVDDFIYDVIRKVQLRPKLATPVESRRYSKKTGFLDARQREKDEGPEEFRLRVREDIETNPEKYFARGPIVRLEHDENEHAGDVWMTAAMMRESKNAKRFPRSPNACRRFHRMCEYFDVCSGAASIEDENRFRTAATPHEELQEV